MNKSPSIITGANAIIRLVGGMTFAYATDVSVKVSVTLIPIEVMSRNSIASYQPGTYRVEGSFSLIKYSQAAYLNGLPNSHPQGNRNPIIQTQEGENYLSDHLNPRFLMTSKTFDIEVIHKTQYGDVVMFKVLDARIADMDISLSKRSLAQARYTFAGTLFSDMENEYNEGVVNDLSTSV